MIYRLSGSESPSNIWKIINAGNTRKDFIKSYSLRNIDGKSFLEVSFNKDYLVNVFNELSIPIIGNSRPVILFIFNVDSGTKNPYMLSNYDNNNDLDIKINDFLNQKSTSRGVFLELPELDLFYMNEIKKALTNLKLSKLPEIICEPGRALVAESGSTIVKVILRKKNNLYI